MKLQKILFMKKDIKNEIIDKMRKILENKKLSESDIFYLFNLARKLLEYLPLNVRKDFALLKFYCDWMVHSTIDRSSVGGLIIEEIQSTINRHINGNNNAQFTADLSSNLSLEKMFMEFNKFLDSCGLMNTDYCKENSSGAFVGIDFVHLVPEILSPFPLRINSTKGNLIPILRRMEQNRITDKAVVKEIAIIKLPQTVFWPNSENCEAHSIEITLSDTTRIIAPICWG